MTNIDKLLSGITEANRHGEFPMSDEPTPIEIRPGKFVLIQGIPHDLTAIEAKRIAKVVLAMIPEDLRVVEVLPRRERPPLVLR